MKAQGTAICSPDFIQGLSRLICLRLFVLLCFTDLASFSNPYPSECSFSCLLWIDLQKDATWQLLRFSTCHCTSRWSKTCIGWKFDRKNLFIFPSLIHKIKEVFSQKYSKVSVSRRDTNTFIIRKMEKKKKKRCQWSYLSSAVLVAKKTSSNVYNHGQEEDLEFYQNQINSC